MHSLEAGFFVKQGDLCSLRIFHADEYLGGRREDRVRGARRYAHFPLYIFFSKLEARATVRGLAGPRRRVVRASSASADRSIVVPAGSINHVVEMLLFSRNPFLTLTAVLAPLTAHAFAVFQLSSSEVEVPPSASAALSPPQAVSQSFTEADCESLLSKLACVKDCESVGSGFWSLALEGRFFDLNPLSLGASVLRFRVPTEA